MNCACTFEAKAELGNGNIKEATVTIKYAKDPMFISASLPAMQAAAQHQRYHLLFFSNVFELSQHEMSLLYSSSNILGLSEDSLISLQWASLLAQRKQQRCHFCEHSCMFVLSGTSLAHHRHCWL